MGSLSVAQPDYPTSGLRQCVYELRLVGVTYLLRWACRVAPRGPEANMLHILLEAYLEVAMKLIRERRRQV
jgi:hypothetical protein